MRGFKTLLLGLMTWVLIASSARRGGCRRGMPGCFIGSGWRRMPGVFQRAGDPRGGAGGSGRSGGHSGTCFHSGACFHPGTR